MAPIRRRADLSLAMTAHPTESVVVEIVKLNHRQYRISNMSYVGPGNESPEANPLRVEGATETLFRRTFSANCRRIKFQTPLIRYDLLAALAGKLTTCFTARTGEWVWFPLS